LPARVAGAPLWIWIVSALATWMSTSWKSSIHTIWFPGAPLNPEVPELATALLFAESNPAHMIKLLGRCNKLAWPTPGSRDGEVVQPMTSTDLLLAGVIAALFVPAARLYEMNAALGVVMVCVAFATTAEVIIATTVARSMTDHREDFWVRISMVF